MKEEGSQMTDTVINVYIESFDVPDLTLIGRFLIYFNFFYIIILIKDLPRINYATNELKD